MTILTVLFHKSDDVRFTSDIDILHAIIDILFNGSSYIVQKIERSFTTLNFFVINENFRTLLWIFGLK